MQNKASSLQLSKLALILVAIGILCLSALGRPLQHWVFENIGKQEVASMVAVVLLSMGFLAVFCVSRQDKQQNKLELIIKAVVIVVIVVLISIYLHRIEERLHFVTFGLFGFFSKRLFPFRQALLLIIVWSIVDEVFQGWLPDRVGDWRDVVLNIVAGLVGASFAVKNIFKGFR